LADNTGKESLRKFLRENRDGISFDLIKIASKEIQGKLKQLDIFRDAKGIAGYYPIGSEVRTQEIMQEILSEGRDLSLPKVNGENLEFRKVADFGYLQKSGFDIMEPKEICKPAEIIDVILVPNIGMTRTGSRLGYGYGYYDRFLKNSDVPSIALTYAKQIVKKIPTSENDVKIDWIVTENEIIDTSTES